MKAITVLMLEPQTQSLLEQVVTGMLMISCYPTSQQIKIQNRKRTNAVQYHPKLRYHQVLAVDQVMVVERANKQKLPKTGVDSIN